VPPGSHFTGIHSTITNVWVGIALVRRHLRNPAKRKNILLATCVAALPLAACNDPQDTTTVAQSRARSWSPATLATIWRVTPATKSAAQ
jgi:hypothetical protein